MPHGQLPLKSTGPLNRFSLTFFCRAKTQLPKGLNDYCRCISNQFDLHEKGSFNTKMFAKRNHLSFIAERKKVLLLNILSALPKYLINPQRAARSNSSTMFFSDRLYLFSLLYIVIFTLLYFECLFMWTFIANNS